MNLVAYLEELLKQAEKNPRKEELRLSAWRILVNESEAVSLGIKDNSPGSVYTPPTYRQGESGEVFLVWADGTCSQANVQLPLNHDHEHWQAELIRWKQASYADPDGAFIPSPEAVPNVEVEDPAIRHIVLGDDEILFEQVKQWLKNKPANGMMQGNIQAAWGYRDIRSSTGLAVRYPQSQFSAWFSLDSLVSGGFAKRRLMQLEEQQTMWSRTVNHYEAMLNKAPEVNSQTQVVLSPSMTDEMLGQFILPNFSGDRVIEGQSAFSKERFLEQSLIFNPHCSISIEPLRPLELGSYLVTSEGVSAKRTLLVQDGKLQTPFLRVKDAVRWSTLPTAIPYGAAGLYLKYQSEVSWKSALETIEDGVLVLSVLGLHTQDSATGTYSLSAPHCLRIIKGQIVGQTDVKLSGNFFEDLSSSSTRAARTDFDLHPYLMIKTGIQTL